MIIVNNTIKTLRKDIDTLKQAQSIIHDFIVKEYDIFTGNECDLFLLIDSYATLSTVVSTLNDVFNTTYEED